MLANNGMESSTAKQHKAKARKRHKIIGLRVKKKFDGVTYYGRITSIDTEIVEGDEKVRKLYHIVYDDGDEEDVYKPEIKKIVIFPKSEKRPSAKSSNFTSTAKQKPVDSNRHSNLPAKPKSLSAQSVSSKSILNKDERKQVRADKSTSSASTKNKPKVPNDATAATEHKILEGVKCLFNSPTRQNNSKSVSAENSDKKSTSKNTIGSKEKKSKEMSSKVATKTKLGDSAPVAGNVKPHNPVKKKRTRTAEDYGRSRNAVKRKRTKVNNESRSLYSYLCHICHSITAPLWRCPKDHRHFFCSLCMCDMDDFEKFASAGCLLCREPDLRCTFICDLLREEDAPKSCWIHRLGDDGETQIKKWPAQKPLPPGFSKGRGYAWIHGTVNGAAVRQLWAMAKPLPPGFVHRGNSSFGPSDAVNPGAE